MQQDAKLDETGRACSVSEETYTIIVKFAEELGLFYPRKLEETKEEFRSRYLQFAVVLEGADGVTVVDAIATVIPITTNNFCEIGAIPSRREEFGDRDVVDEGSYNVEVEGVSQVVVCITFDSKPYYSEYFQKVICYKNSDGSVFYRIVFDAPGNLEQAGFWQSPQAYYWLRATLPTATDLELQQLTESINSKNESIIELLNRIREEFPGYIFAPIENIETVRKQVTGQRFEPKTLSIEQKVFHDEQLTLLGLLGIPVVGKVNLKGRDSVDQETERKMLDLEKYRDNFLKIVLEGINISQKHLIDPMIVNPHGTIKVLENVLGSRAEDDFVSITGNKDCDGYPIFLVVNKINGDIYEQRKLGGVYCETKIGRINEFGVVFMNGGNVYTVWELARIGEDKVPYEEIE